MACRSLAVAVLGALLFCAGAASAADAPTVWDGTNPFKCELQQAGLGPTGAHPEADPYCIEFDKRHQNVSQLGVVDFLSKEPARVAAASSKCFYFQSDHWRGSLVQDNGATKTYEWDGHYFFDKAQAEGGAWVTNFNVNGQTGDPSQVPGMPPEYARFFGPGTGGFRTHNSVPADPACVARAQSERDRVYAGPQRPRCVSPRGKATKSRLGPIAIGQTEESVRAALGPPAVVKRGFLRWCVRRGHRFLVGERGDRSGELGAGDDRAVVVLTTWTGVSYRGVRPGARLRTLRRRLRGELRMLRYGDVTVYLARKGSPIVFGVRRGRVRFLAVRDRHAVRGAAGLRRYLLRAR